MAFDPAIFKAYDIRGIYPSQINELTVEKIGRAYSAKFNPRTVIVGADVRVSSPNLKAALIEGLTTSGVDVIDIGTVSTDMMYFAVVHLQADGGLIVSASHNPAEYNGLKVVIKDAVPVSSDSGLLDLRDLVQKDDFKLSSEIGSIASHNILADYLKHLRKFVDLNFLPAFKLVGNGNFGMAGTVVKELFKDTAIELTLINDVPDGTFPKGRPDPMWANNREEISNLVTSSGAHLGVAWDADADRCFFFDEQGRFINPYYITALLAGILLKREPGSKILIDPRLIWATTSIVEKAGGEVVINKAGHTFIKERMRKDNILFGGETSAHYYFKDNYYTDNGMIPLLLVLRVMTETKLPLSELVGTYQELACCIDETNFTLPNGKEIVAHFKEIYTAAGAEIQEIDGVSISFPQWRFNLRPSNTEPLLRLNLEARNSEILNSKFEELKNQIEEVSKTLAEEKVALA